MARIIGLIRRGTPASARQSAEVARELRARADAGGEEAARDGVATVEPSITGSVVTLADAAALLAPAPAPGPGPTIR